MGTPAARTKAPAGLKQFEICGMRFEIAEGTAPPMMLAQNKGHPPPALRRRRDGENTRIKDAHDAVLVKVSTSRRPGLHEKVKYFRFQHGQDQ